MKLIGAKEVAEMLGVSTNWVNDRTRSRTRPEDRIPFIKLGRHVRFSDAEIIEWAFEQRGVPKPTRLKVVSTKGDNNKQ